MADGLDFARVEVVVCEANEPLRRNIQQLLRQLGFGEVAVKEHPEECLPLVERGPVDLLICDDQGDHTACFEMVHGLRHHAIDNNPFVVSIGMVDQKTRDRGTVGRAVNAGSDALIVKPFTSAVFIERIFAVAERRRPFVATADYIGPTRRQRPRNKREALMEFIVPNPVQEIATGRTREAVAALIRKGTVLLDRRKLRADLDEIEMRANQVLDAIARGVDGDIIGQALARLRAATTDISRRMALDEVQYVPELCHWMLAVVDRLDGDPAGADPRILAVMPEIVRGLGMALGNTNNGGRPAAPSRR